MAEAAAATTAAAPASETKTAPPVSTPVASPPSTEAPEAQPPAQKTDDERRAQRIAAARRESARVAAEREAISRERAAHAEDLRLAADYRRLDAIRKTDPVKYLEEVGLKIGDVSRKYLEQNTGKTPEQIAEEVYARKEAERQKRETETSGKAQEEAAIRAREAAYAGAKTTLAKMVTDGGERFSTLAKLSAGGLGDVAVDKAFKLIEDYHRETKQILDFGKALDAVEAKFKVLAKGEEPVAVSVPAAAKPAAGVKSAQKVEADVSEVKPSTTQLTRRMTPRDQKRIARELVQASLAAKDT